MMKPTFKLKVGRFWERAAMSPQRDGVNGTRSLFIAGHPAPGSLRSPREIVISVMTNVYDMYRVPCVPSTGRASPITT